MKRRCNDDPHELLYWKLDPDPESLWPITANPDRFAHACSFLEGGSDAGSEKQPIQAAAAQLQDKLLHGRRLAKVEYARAIILEPTFDPVLVDGPFEVTLICLLISRATTALPTAISPQSQKACLLSVHFLLLLILLKDGREASL